MSGAHLHLLLNHIPTVAFGVAVALFVAGLIKKSADLTQAGFIAFFLNALLSIPAYVSGNAETCNITTAQTGTYYVMLNGYAALAVRNRGLVAGTTGIVGTRSWDNTSASPSGRRLLTSHVRFPTCRTTP